MASVITLTPAYGRDYKSSEAVKRDWFDNKDFILCDITDVYYGKPVNMEQLKSHVGYVHVRYNRLRRVCVIKQLRDVQSG